MTPDYSAFSLFDLFRTEADTHVAALTSGLLALERDATDPGTLESLMRAAHSLKGAALVVGVDAVVRVTHVMEDCFVAAQKGKHTLGQPQVDALLGGVDLLTRIAQTAEAEMKQWSGSQDIKAFLARLSASLSGEPVPLDVKPAILNGESTIVRIEPHALSTEPSREAVAVAEIVACEPAHGAPAIATNGARAHERGPAAAPTSAANGNDRVLRVTADHLDRLLGLASESLVESRWLDPFARSLLRLKRMQAEVSKSLDALRDSLAGTALSEQAQTRLAEAQTKAADCRQFLGVRLVEVENFDRRSGNLSRRLYDEALACRMRPFTDGAQGFPRMVRDVARTLGKDVKFTITGEATQVDRDILEKLEAPISHMLRNALDHAIESADERERAGKPHAGSITLDARHSAGTLVITVRDDGRGIDVERVRRAVVTKNLTTGEVAAKMGDSELLDFLFLPGFSMKETVTEISGRGVGLDVVQDAMKALRGTFRVSSELGKGTSIQLQLPLTLSVLRALVVEIGGEAYGMPLASLMRTVKVSRDRIATIEGRQHFELDGQRVGLVSAHQIFEQAEGVIAGDDLPVIVIGDRGERYGLVVDRFLGERELVVQPLDARLGKIKDISAGALTDDGTPLLIMDVEDLIRSVQKLSSAGRLTSVQRGAEQQRQKRKRVLVVDDSLTVRELERKLLEGRGYDVEIAVDGMDGWNAVRTGGHDLVITDVDMPRMDGVELTSLIRKDPNLKTKPVMIVSYKDREADRVRGLEAGADHYLTKGSFHDESFVQAVTDLIGVAA